MPTPNANFIADVSDIPSEVFFQILENLPQTSLASTALANSSFRTMSEKLMYRRLDLVSAGMAISCCETILGGARREEENVAEMVKELVVHFDALRPPAPPQFTSLLSSALGCMHNLSTIHLVIEGPFASILESCFFPSLTTFSSIIDLTPADWEGYMAPFLVRHRTITHLCMGGEGVGVGVGGGGGHHGGIGIPGGPNQGRHHEHFLLHHPHTNPFTLPPSSLPALQEYVGTRRLAPHLIPHRPITRLTLAWNTPNPELEIPFIIPPLSLSTGPITQFRCATLGWSSALITALSVHLPELEGVRYHNLSGDYHNEAELWACLSKVLGGGRWRGLRRLEVPCKGMGTGGKGTIFTRENERSVLGMWEKMCERLEEVRFSSGRVWRRGRGGKGKWVMDQ